MFVHKKRFGQNFLHNSAIISKIVNYIDLSNRNVVEIGVGKGALTKELIKFSRFVTGFEIDNTLKDFIRNTFGSSLNFKAVFEDFLSNSLAFENNTIIVSNPPYNISSPIIFKFLETNYYSEAILMFQEELANRILACSGTKAYGKLSVIIDTFCTKEKIIKVDKKYFNPIPEIDSVVFYLKKRETPLISQSKMEVYFSFLSNCFSMKRKKLINNIVKNFKVKKEKMSCVTINLERRPEELSAEEYVNLFNQMYEKKVLC